MLSDKVPYYILDLLQITPSVHVEGLGRFEAIFHSASVDIYQNRIKPPYLEPDFSEESTSQGVQLSDYLAYATGVDAVTARHAVLVFRNTVLEKTENGGLWTIEKFGTFSKSSFGNIRFTPDWDAFNLSFSGLETLPIKAQAEQPSPPVYVPPVFPEEPVHNVEETIVPAVTDEVSITYPDIRDEEVKPEDTITPESTQDAIDQKTTRLWWTILLSAIVLITVLCAYLAWDIISNRQKLDDLKQVYPDSTTDVTTGTLPAPIDSTPIDVTNIPLENTETPPATQSPEEVEECYVVVGAFTDPANVTRMEERLTAMGYTTKEIQGGTLIRVAIVTSCASGQLQKTLNDARSTINPEAWIY